MKRNLKRENLQRKTCKEKLAKKNLQRENLQRGTKQFLKQDPTHRVRPQILVAVDDAVGDTLQRTLRPREKIINHGAIDHAWETPCANGKFWIHRTHAQDQMQILTDSFRKVLNQIVGVVQ